MMFRGELYSQIDGVSMRSPIASLPAEICMNWFLDQTLSKGSQSNSMNSSKKYDQTKRSVISKLEEHNPGNTTRNSTQETEHIL